MIDADVPVSELLEELRQIRDTPELNNRLHPLEQQMVVDLLHEPRYLRCAACLRWMRKLRDKARRTAH